MVDFLRANTWCSREEYMWEMTVGQIRLASLDYSHTDFSNKKRHTSGKSKKQKAKAQVIGSGADLRNLNDLGRTIFNKKQ